MKILKEKLESMEELLEKLKGERRTQIEELEKEIRIAKYEEVEREKTEKIRHSEELSRVKEELEKVYKVGLVSFPDPALPFYYYTHSAAECI